MGKNKEALNCLDKALELNPKNLLAWFNKGTYLVVLEDIQQAIRCFDKVLEQDSRHQGGLV